MIQNLSVYFVRQKAKECIHILDQNLEFFPQNGSFLLVVSYVETKANEELFKRDFVNSMQYYEQDKYFMNLMKCYGQESRKALDR